MSTPRLQRPIDAAALISGVWLAAQLTGSPTLDAIVAFLLPWLAFWATTDGSGTAAYYVLNELRRRYPLPAKRPPGLRAHFYALIYAPRYARITAMITAAAIGLLATGALAWLQGQPIIPTIDEALTTMLASAVFSQIRHGKTLPNTPPQIGLNLAGFLPPPNARWYEETHFNHPAPKDES